MHPHSRQLGGHVFCLRPRGGRWDAQAASLSLARDFDGGEARFRLEGPVSHENSPGQRRPPWWGPWLGSTRPGDQQPPPPPRGLCFPSHCVSSHTICPLPISHHQVSALLPLPLPPNRELSHTLSCMAMGWREGWPDRQVVGFQRNSKSVLLAASGGFASPKENKLFFFFFESHLEHGWSSPTRPLLAQAPGHTLVCFKTHSEAIFKSSVPGPASRANSFSLK